MALYGASAHVCPVSAETMGEALSNGAFLIVKADSNGKMVKCTAGAQPYGVLVAEVPEALASGDEVTVQISDIAPVKCGGTIAKGAMVASDSAGKAVTVADSAIALGMALEAGTSGKVISVKLA